VRRCSSTKAQRVDWRRLLLAMRHLAIIAGMRASRATVASLAIGLVSVLSADLRAQPRCVAGELLLPAHTPWVTLPIEDLPAGREGCLSLRAVARREFAGVIVFRATPRDTPEIADAPHPRLMLETIARLAEMNVRIDEPKWRKLDVSFSGFEGFGKGTMFGFDGVAIDDGEKSDVVFLVFDGPAFHYDVTLVTAAEATDPEVFKANLTGFRALLAGLNRAKRP